MSNILPKRFINLHSHTGSSAFDGLGLPKQHFDFVIENSRDELEVPAMAITEHGHANSFAHAFLYAKELNKAGKPFKYLPGVEAYFHPDLKQWARDKAADAEAIEDEQHRGTVENEDETKSSKFYDPVKRRHHLVILPKSSAGLQKMFSVISKGYMEGFYKFPRIDYSMLKPHKGEFVVQTACIGGPLSYTIFKSFPTATFDDLRPSLVDDPQVRLRILAMLENDLDQMIDAVGAENLFLELQFNKLNAQHLTNRMLIELSKKTGVKLTVTADSHYYRPDVWREREIYKKLGWLNYADISPKDLPKSIDDLKCELYPKNAKQMWDAYKATTQAYDFYDDQLVCDAIERSYDVAFNVIGDVKPDTAPKFPKWCIPAQKTAEQALRDECAAGMKRLGLDGKPEYVSRLEMELGVVKAKDFFEYFLTMKKIIDVASEEMLVGPGRGSAPGALINYVLGITQIDPIEYGLIFERFVNINREEAPDIDSDLADRDLLITRLKEKFGDANVVPISNYNTFALKSLIKDVARFFHEEGEDDGLDFKTVNAVLTPLDDEVRNKVLKQGDDKNLFELKFEDCLKHSARFREFMEAHPEIARPVEVLLHENKALGKHAGGVIVSENVHDRMPLIMSRKELQTPFVEGMHYKHLNEFGWIKFDLLGLETLRIINRCIELILQRHEGIKLPTFKDVKAWYDKKLHPSVLDVNDGHVYEHIYHGGRWAGIFQVTQGGAQKFFVRGKPNSIIDIAALTSIYRPGPLAAKVDNIYIEAKANPEAVVYEHPLVKQCLEKTYNTIIFQESLMQLGHVVGGLSLEKCDKLRKVITKRSVSGASKAKEEALKLEKEFIAGAVQRGLAEKQAIDLFEKISFFSGYGFNSAHAVSYAINSYQCAYLCTYFEPEWLCAYMETQAGDPDKRSKAISELKSFGYEIVGVDINHATDQWTIMPDKKFMPSFLTVKGTGPAAVQEIEMYRPYRTVDDLLWNPDGSWRHSKFNKRTFESLIKLRAFGSMDIVGPGKVFPTWKAMHDAIIPNLAKLKHPKKGRPLFDELVKQHQATDEWSTQELVAFSKDIVGSFDLDLVIPRRVRDKLDEIDVPSIDDFDVDHAPPLYWFIAEETAIKTSKNGKQYLLITASGPAGKRYKIYVWSFSADKHDIMPNQVYIADLAPSQFGFSTQAWKIRSINQRKDRAA